MLGVSSVYSAIQRGIGGPDGRARVVREHIVPQPGDRVLDIGCGPATMLPYIGDVTYTGLDLSPAYIETAQRTYGGRGTFLCLSVDDMAGRIDEKFDLALAIALLHHLTDAQALAMLKSARACLKPGGRLVTLDCAWTTPQHPIAKLLIGLDRGQNVRTPEAFADLARVHFPSVDVAVRTDLNRVPYTHCILTCRVP
jgi:SAM-dependent methyltransferase